MQENEPNYCNSLTKVLPAVSFGPVSHKLVLVKAKEIKEGSLPGEEVALMVWTVAFLDG
jgi:hypothetical protein